MHNKETQSAAGFGVVGVAVVVVAVVVLGFLGWRFYDAAKNKTPSPTAHQTSSTSGSKATTPKPTPSSYDGWQSVTLKYEKATFKYPSTWKLTNTSTAHSSQDAVMPGYDKATIVSPTSLTVTIDTGVSGIGDGPYGGTVLSSAPIATLGGNYYLGFGNVDPGSPNSVNGGTIGTTSDRTATWPSSKNISSVNGKAFNVVSVGYFDAAGNAIAKPVSAFQSDASYNDALLIIKSLSY